MKHEDRLDLAALLDRLAGYDDEWEALAGVDAVEDDEEVDAQWWTEAVELAIATASRTGQSVEELRGAFLAYVEGDEDNRTGRLIHEAAEDLLSRSSASWTPGYDDLAVNWHTPNPERIVAKLAWRHGVRLLRADTGRHTSRHTIRSSGRAPRARRLRRGSGLRARSPGDDDPEHAPPLDDLPGEPSSPDNAFSDDTEGDE